MTKTVISSLEKPRNLDKLEELLKKLSSLSYMGDHSLIAWFNYESITPPIAERFNSATIPIKCRLDVDSGLYKEMFRNTPQQILQLLTPPFPVQIETYFAPESWTEGGGIEKHCRLASFFSMTYWIELDGKSNEYYITREPRKTLGLDMSSDNYRVIEAPFENGLPSLCRGHSPYVQTCAPRFQNIREIFDGAGLPEKLEKQVTPLDFLDIIPKNKRVIM